MARFGFLAVVAAVIAALAAHLLSRPSPRQDSITDKPNSSDGRRWFASGEDRPPPDIAASISRYELNVPPSEVEAMYAKLNSTRLLGSPIVEADDWSYGVPPDVAEKVISRFATGGFDWHSRQREINALFPQFVTNIAGLDLHFAHVRPPPGGPILPPLMLIHGWPGSFLEFGRILPLLRPHFEIVIPSIPGYGPSEGAARPGMDVTEVGLTFFELMSRLGHERFFVQGGDWGSFISQRMARIAPDRIRGMHLNFFAGPVPLPFGPAQLLLARSFPSLTPFGPEDLPRVVDYKSNLLRLLGGLGYFAQQSTKPDTLCYGLADSPAGWTMWVLEKFYEWTDVDSFDGLLERFELDDVLANAALYYLTGSIGTAARFYKENAHMHFSADARESLPASVPVGLSDFPGEIFGNLPEAWARKRFPGLVSYDRHDVGGHFAAMEQPDALAADLVAFARKVERTNEEPGK